MKTFTNSDLTRRTMASATLVLLSMALSATAGHAVDIKEKLMTSGYKEGRVVGDVIDTVMIHFSSNVAANKESPYDVEAVVALYAASKSSAHYLIARDGTIYRLIKESDTAWHAGTGIWKERKDNLNQFSIGIEVLGIGTADEMKRMINMTQKDYEKIPKEHIGFAEAQYKALKALLQDIEKRNTLVKHDRDHIIGHDGYAPGRKQDPGSLFDWSKVGL